MSMIEPTFFEKLSQKAAQMVPVSLRMGNWDNERLEDERRKTAAVVLLRAKEGKNRDADLEKLRVLSIEMEKRKPKQEPIQKAKFAFQADSKDSA